MMKPKAEIHFVYDITWADGSALSISETKYGGFAAWQRAQDLGIKVSDKTLLQAFNERVYKIKKLKEQALQTIPFKNERVECVTVKIKRMDTSEKNVLYSTIN